MEGILIDLLKAAEADEAITLIEIEDGTMPLTPDEFIDVEDALEALKEHLTD